MDFLNFTDVSFNPKESVGQLCEDLNNIMGKAFGMIRFIFKIRNGLQFVHAIITDMNNDKVMCSCFGLHPSYVAGILNTVKDIHFYILCEEKLNYVKYITKFLARKNYTVKFLSKIHLTCVWEEHFQLTLDGETVTISLKQICGSQTSTSRLPEISGFYEHSSNFLRGKQWDTLKNMHIFRCFSGATLYSPL